MDTLTVQSVSPHPLGNKAVRVLWKMVWTFFYRPSPRLLHGWRRFLLRLFGAKIAAGAHPYPSAQIWAPWNLEMGADSCLGDKSECYNVARVTLGANATISQYAYLCSATHDYEDPGMPMIKFPITIGANAWICTGSFIGPGVSVGEGAVVGARSTVSADVPPWTVVAGSPAQIVKKRKIRTAP